MNIYNHEQKFNDSKYTKWYYGIIERALQRDTVIITDFLQKTYLLQNQRTQNVFAGSFQLHESITVIVTDFLKESHLLQNQSTRMRKYCMYSLGDFNCIKLITGIITNI